jgi:hypothetical protein
MSPVSSSFYGLSTSCSSMSSNSFVDDDETSEFGFQYSSTTMSTSPPPQPMHPSSLPIPCPNAESNILEREAEECQTEMYNRSTWNMYNR